MVDVFMVIVDMESIIGGIAMEVVMEVHSATLVSVDAIMDIIHIMVHVGLVWRRNNHYLMQNSSGSLQILSNLVITQPIAIKST